MSAVGVGAPGPLDPEIIRSAPKLYGWEDVPLAGVIEERVGVAAILGNDANVAALGLAYGPGRGAERLIYLMTISTGIGSGFVAGGRPLEGCRGAGSRAHGDRLV